MPKKKLAVEVLSVPNFTADDYLNSTAPYEWLTEHGTDKFTLQRLVELMKRSANSAGVRAFMKLWTDYQASMAELEDKPWEKHYVTVSIPGREDIELATGEYQVSERGVFTVDKTGFPVRVCPHMIAPIRRLVNVDTDVEQLEIAYIKGTKAKTVIVEKSALASSQKILDLASVGVVVNADNAKLLSTYLFTVEEINFSDIPERRSVGRLGWIKDHGFSPYLDSLEFDGETTFKHIFNTVHEQGSYKKWLTAARSVRAEKTVARVALATSFASAILEPCGLLPFFVHAWGTTGGGKTVLLMLAASVWADPALGGYVTTFNSTSVGQETVAGFLNSLPLCLDELQIQSSQGVKDFDKTIYQLTEGVGKTRGAKAGGLQQQRTWKNCIITSGEHPISNSASGGGAVNRVIEFEVEEKIYSDLVGLSNVIQKNYGFAGSRFVEWLQEDGHSEAIKEIQMDYYRKLLDSDTTEKQALSASAILAADQIVTGLIFQDGNGLTVEDMSGMLLSKNDVDQNARALEYLYELISRNPQHFMEGAAEDLKVEVWGKIKDGWIYIIKSVFDREMGAAGFHPSSFLSWAKRHDLLITDIDGRRTRKIKVGTVTVNTVCIHQQDETVAAECAEGDADDELPL